MKKQFILGLLLILPTVTKTSDRLDFVFNGIFASSMIASMIAGVGFTGYTFSLLPALAAEEGYVLDPRYALGAYSMYACARCVCGPKFNPELELFLVPFLLGVAAGIGQLTEDTAEQERRRRPQTIDQGTQTEPNRDFAMTAGND